MTGLFSQWTIFCSLCGLLLCYFIGWKWKPQLLVGRKIEQEGKRFYLSKLWIFCIGYLAPVLILIVTVSGFAAVYHGVAGS